MATEPESLRFRDLSTGRLQNAHVKAFAGRGAWSCVSTELDLSEEDGGSVRDEAGRKVPGDLSSQPLLGHLSYLGCDFLLGMACGSVATWGRCQSSWVNDAVGAWPWAQWVTSPPPHQLREEQASRVAPPAPPAAPPDTPQRGLGRIALGLECGGGPSAPRKRLRLCSLNPWRRRKQPARVERASWAASHLGAAAFLRPPCHPGQLRSLPGTLG